MPEIRGAFSQVNLVVRDVEVSLAFYRLLGVEVTPGPEWPAGSGFRHAEVSMTSAATLEWDNEPFAGKWAPGWERPRGAVLGFAFEESEAVDTVVGRVSEAGHRVVQEPYDAFWGARYAIVEDPDGNLVGLMGPIDPTRRFVPDVSTD